MVILRQRMGGALLDTELIAASGSNYIRYNSGIQIAFGHATTNNRTTFGAPFVNSEYAIVAQYKKYDGAWESCCTGSWDASGFTPKMGAKSYEMACDYVAIGKWK